MKRTRLSPEARRNQILDVAKESIASGGLQRFSLKQLASLAGISEPLLFHYFSSRLDLLQQLLIRDYDSYLESIAKSIDDAETREDVFRVYVARNYDHHDEDLVMDLLLDEPEVAVAVEERRSKHRKQRRKLLINAVASEMGIKRKNAALLVRMASAASIAAAEFAHENGMRREEAIDTVMQFIEQGFASQDSKP